MFASADTIIDAGMTGCLLLVWAWVAMSSWNLVVAPVYPVPAIGFAEILGAVLGLRMMVWGFTRCRRLPFSGAGEAGPQPVPVLPVEKAGPVRYIGAETRPDPSGCLSHDSMHSDYR